MSADRADAPKQRNRDSGDSFSISPATGFDLLPAQYKHSGRHGQGPQSANSGHRRGIALPYNSFVLKRSFDRESNDVVAPLERKVDVTPGGHNDVLLAIHRVRCRGRVDASTGKE